MYYKIEQNGIDDSKSKEQKISVELYKFTKDIFEILLNKKELDLQTF